MKAFTPRFTNERRAALPADMVVILDNLVQHDKRDKKFAEQQLDAAKNYIAENYAETCEFGAKLGEPPQRCHTVGLELAKKQAMKWQKGELKFWIIEQQDEEKRQKHQAEQRQKNKQAKSAQQSLI